MGREPMIIFMDTVNSSRHTYRVYIKSEGWTIPDPLELDKVVRDMRMKEGIIWASLFFKVANDPIVLLLECMPV